VEKRIQVKRRTKRRKICSFCADKFQVVDYKETSIFKRFITERGKIYPRRNSGLCAKHQRVLANAIKRARYIGLVPYSVD